MEQIEQLRQQARSAAEKIEAIETAERRKANAPKVGKTFRDDPVSPAKYNAAWKALKAKINAFR